MNDQKLTAFQRRLGAGVSEHNIPPELIEKWEREDRGLEVSSGGTGATSVTELIKRVTGAEPMTEARVREIWGHVIDQDGGLSSADYLNWTPGNTTVTLNDYFTADQLEAIAWWMRNKKEGA